MGRSFAAMAAGFLAWTLLWLTANASLSTAFGARFNADGSTDDRSLLLTILVLSLVISIFAGWLTARVASHSGLRHALGLGIIQLLVGTFVQLQYWDVMPLWYHLGFLALLLPGHVLGGWCRARCKPVVMA